MDRSDAAHPVDRRTPQTRVLLGPVVVYTTNSRNTAA